jgi:hypothetical protein
MKYAIKMRSSGMIHIPSSIKIGSDSKMIAYAYFNVFEISKVG